MRHLLPTLLLPPVYLWIAWQERRIRARGIPLNAAQLADAVSLGIENPQRIRVLLVARIPFPAIRLTEAAARLAGVSLAQTLGLSARYGIFLRTDCSGNRRLLVHELMHTRQFERLGGFRPFLRQYLRECLTAGYSNSALEHEAAAAAEHLCR